MRSIAFMAEKGGGGKTSSTLNVAAGLAARGFKTLVADVDPQGNSSLVLLRGEKARRPTVHEVLTAQATADEAIVATATPNLDLLPATPGLAEANVDLVNEMGRERRLRSALEGLSRPYDFVLVDTSPLRTLLNINVLNAVEEVIVPIAPGLFSLAGLAQLQEVVEEVRKFLDNRTLRIAGLLVTMVEKSNVSREVEAQLRAACGDLVFRATIPRSVKVEEAHSRSQSVLDYAPGSPGAKAYKALVEEILTNGQHGQADRPRGASRRARPAHDAA
jgi:chromosome partitioning protein